MTHLRSSWLVAELGDYLHLLGVWVALAIPVAAIVSSVRSLSQEVAPLLSTEGLVLGTVLVVALELTDNRPSLLTAWSFFLVDRLLASLLVFPAVLLIDNEGVLVVATEVLALCSAVAIVVFDGDELLGRTVRGVTNRLLPPPAGRRDTDGRNG